MDIDRREFELGGPGKVEELLDQLVYPIDLSDHDISEFRHRRVAAVGAAQQLRRALDPTQWVSIS